MIAARLRFAFFVGLAFAPVLAAAVYHGAVQHWLCDDAFISFRYVRNLVDGHGLVWNVGERVEGYTNFLWVLELAFVWKVFGVAPEHAAAILSWLLTGLTYALTASLAARTLFARRAWPAMWGALTVLAASRTFAVWATSGLETRQFTMLVILAVHELTSPDARIRRVVFASLALAGCELTRPEGNLIFACCVTWLVADLLWRGELRWRRVLALAVPYVIVVGAHMAFRWVYYGDLFPNTYYAKHVQSWPEGGFHYFTLIFAQTGLPWFLALSALAATARALARRDTSGLLFLGLILPHMYYVFRIGGDHFEFRPLDFYWPMLAVLAVDGIFALGRGAVHVVRPPAGWKAALVDATAVTATFVVLMYASNIMQYGHYCLSYELRSREQTFRLTTPITEKSFPAAFFLPGMRQLAALHNAASEYCSQHSIACPQVEHKIYWKLQAGAWGRYARWAGKMGIPPDAVTNFVTIGISSYYLPEIQVIDCLGLTDRHVAHQPVHVLNKNRNMAHDRHATAEYIESRGMNILPCPPAASLLEAMSITRYALKLADDVWFPFDSARPDWVRTWAKGRVYMRTKLKNIGLAETRSLDGWQIEGQALENQPSRARRQGNQQAITGAGPHWLINTYHPLHGDAATGSALSPEFTATYGHHLTFRVGGGSNPQVGVELTADGVTVKQWRGRDNEELEPVVYDLTPHSGKALRVRVFDETPAGWGHVVATGFEVLSLRPQPVEAASAPGGE